MAKMIRPESIAFKATVTEEEIRARMVEEVRLFLDPRVDLHVGLGLTTRKNAEFVIMGTRGKSLRQSKSVFEVGMFPRMEHSRKPVQFRERIEQYVGPGRIMGELFARTAAPGWVAFGDEIGKF